jgi:Kef-type K+ transport system membrane component KefB
MVPILALAILSAFTTFKIDTWTLIAIAFVFLIGSIAFGYFSPWELPKVATRIQKQQMEFTLGTATRDAVRKPK